MILHGKIAIITGASSGLGAATATALVEKGATVYGLARSKDKLNLLQEKLGEQFHPVPLDITQQDAIISWVKNIFSENHCPDILINNAGVGSFGKIDTLPTTEWIKMMNTNLNGMYYITASLTPLMKIKTSSKHIINIGSILGTMGKEDATAYCATKFGVQGFSESLFHELRHFNIKVTCVNPGSIETNFFKDSGITTHSNMLQAKDVADTLIYILETPDNMLINELTVRPLNPKQSKNLH